MLFWQHLARPVTIAFFVGCLLGQAGMRAATGDDQVVLRWDLPEGSVWALHVQQQYETRVGFSGKVADTRYDLTLDATLRVVARQEDRVTVHQTIDQIVMEVTLPTGARLRFDSASQERPAPGPAAELAAALRSLVGATFELVQSRRGEVEDVRPVGQVAEQWLARSEDGRNESNSVKRALSGALGQCLLLLPEGPVGPQQTWRHVRTEESPLGQVQVHTTYRLDLPSSQDGKDLWPIRFTSEMTVPSSAQGDTTQQAAAQPTPGPPPSFPLATRRNPLQLKHFQQSGTVWFSVEQMRPVSADLQNHLTLTQVYRDLTITAETKLRQQVTLQPKNGAKMAPGGVE